MTVAGPTSGRALRLHPIQNDLLQRVIVTTGERGSERIRVLVVEDDRDQGELVLRALERQSFDATVVADGGACLEAVARTAYAIIVLDYSLPRMNGLQVLAELRGRGVTAPVVMVTAQGDERLAIEAMKAGGTDFLVKTPGYLVALPTVLRKVLKQHELALENERLHEETQSRLRAAEALLDLAHTLTSTLEMKALLGKIGQATARACDMERCSIFAYEDGRVRPLMVQFADGREDHVLMKNLQDAEPRWLEELPFVADAIRSRGAVVINDLANDPRLPPSGSWFRPRALLALPLVRQDAVTGALVLDRTERAEPIAPSQVMLGTTMASHVALALDNARLYEEAQCALSELRDAQERLVRGETLRALGELASGAAHHLNNLLAVITGRTQLMLRTMPLGPLRRPLEIIDRSAKESAEVVRRIQEFARTQQVEESSPVDLSQVATDVLEMTRVRWHDAAIAQGITIEVAGDLGAIPPVSGHAAALREVVMNLILNAIDALPQGGAIAIRTWLDGPNVFLSVADDGIGMSPEVLRCAQEPFFTTKGVKSTGLGLSVSYGIIQRHGGEIAITSTEARGTTVTVRLPAHGDRGEASGAAAPACRPGRLRILVVDDEEEVREAIAELLDAEGHRVTVAADARDALAKLEAGPAPDVVLTDLGMPGMTGRELARAVKERWPTLSVGLVTGWGEEPEPGGQERRGADFVISKPVSVDRLLDAIAGTRVCQP